MPRSTHTGAQEPSRRKPREPITNDATTHRLRHYIDTGLTVAEMAERDGVTQKATWRRLERRGLRVLRKMRPKIRSTEQTKKPELKTEPPLPRQTFKRVNQARRDEISRLVQSGKNRKGIAEKIGIHIHKVDRYLKILGFTAIRAPHSPREMSDRQKQISDLLQNGHSQSEIARLLGVSRQAVSKSIKRLNSLHSRG